MLLYPIYALFGAVHGIGGVIAEFDVALDQEIEDRGEIARRIRRDLNSVGHAPPVVRRSCCQRWRDPHRAIRSVHWTAHR